MEAERWRRIEEIFLRAIDLPPPERESWIEQACAGDAEMRSRIVSMIEEDDRATGSLARPIEVAAAEAHAAQHALRIGQRLGPYHLERELGRGGMGTVYLATRDDDQYSQRVAIKVATGALDSAEVLRRFRAEREILARLEHPNIARLLDAGTTPEGLPYVVMEHVEGRPIDTYCDEERLATLERVTLFRGVCAAVQHAHRNLVVHRDLKPSNVLVTGDGVPKLLDFGIAKLLDPHEQSPLGQPTRTGLRLLTPGYASPEQVRGEPVTTASDVYSLGVLLYELLTGRPPYELDTTRPSEVERVICEVEPERPSLIVTREPAPQRRLGRALAGDLDTIVLTALRKEPSRRYGSVEQLGEDLRRHLEGLPVLARPDTWRYRAGKFVGRHKVETAATLILIALTIGFGSSLLLQVRRTARERDTAERVTEFLVDVFRVPDPASGRGRDVTAREVLDTAAEQIDSELAGRPLVRAQLMEAMGRAYLGLGLYDPARPLLDRALALRREELGANAPLVAESLMLRAGLAVSEADLAEAEDLARQAVRIARRDARRDPRMLVRALRSLGAALSAQGRAADAGEVLREALAVARPIAWDDDPRPLVGTLQELGWIAENRGDFAAAESLYREALAIVEPRYGRESTQFATVLGYLGGLKRTAGSYVEAEPLLREALGISQRVRGERHPSTATTLEELAKLLNNTNRGREAIPLFREALSIQEENNGEKSFAAVVTKANLALVHWDLDELAEAEALDREVVAVLRELVGERQPDYIASLNNLAQVLHQRKAYQEADAMFTRVVELQRSLDDGDKAGLAYYLNNFGMLLRDKGDRGRAEALLREALELRRDSIGAGHPLTAASMCNLAALLTERGEYEEAEPLLREALAAERERLPAGHGDIASTLVDLGRLLVLTGRAEEAEPLLREAVEAYRSKSAAAPWRTAVSEVALAASIAAQGRHAEAGALARPALAVLEKADRLDRVATLRHLLPR